MSGVLVNPYIISTIAVSPPVNTGLPAVTGVPFTAGVLTATNGTWSGSPTGFTYQWQSGGVNIGGATASSYTVLLADESASITCNVTASNTAGNATASSAAVAIAISLQWIAADNPGNVTTAISQTFLPSDVDLSGNKVNITTLALNRTSDGIATHIYFDNTGGSLPSPLVAGTPYYAENITGGLRLYAVNAPADYTAVNGYTAGEYMLPTLNWFFKLPITLTDQGNGTHRIYSNTIATTLTDKTGQGRNYTNTNINSLFELKTDANGIFIEQEGTIGMEGSDPQYGKLLNMSGDKLTLGNKCAGKSWLWSVVVNTPNFTKPVTANRRILQPSNVVPGTGVFTDVAHGFTTPIQVDAATPGIGAVLPAGFPIGNIFVHAIDLNTFTLHPTATDATNNTNVYTYTDAGTGVFSITDFNGSRIANGRELIFDQNQMNNDHWFSPQAAMLSKNGIGLGSTTFFLTGGSSGELNFAVNTTLGQSNWGVTKVSVFIPARSVWPICTDTGATLPEGDYYATPSPTNSTRIRLHRTLANAQACLGVATASCSSTNCIKYGTLGTGTGTIYPTDLTILRMFDDGVVQSQLYNLTIGGAEFGVYVYMIDYNDPGGFRKWFVGKNALSNLLNSVTNRTSTTIPGATVNSQIGFSNAAQPHVPGRNRLSEYMIGVSTSDPSAIVQMVVNAMRAKYGV